MKEELEMIKAFAELEGVALTKVLDAPNGVVVRYVRHHKTFNPRATYNPITDLALNCAARDKYEVTVDYSKKEVSAGNQCFRRCFLKSSEIHLLVIEVILRLKGKWVE